VAYDRGDPVLVYSDRGVSRSAAVIVAFISFKMRLTCQVNSLEFFFFSKSIDLVFQQALEYVERHRDVRPQQSFLGCIDQLNEKLQELKEAMSNAEENN